MTALAESPATRVKSFASARIRNASISELRFRSRDFDWHPERVALIGFNATHHLPPELHTEY